MSQLVDLCEYAAESALNGPAVGGETGWAARAVVRAGPGLQVPVEEGVWALLGEPRPEPARDRALRVPELGGLETRPRVEEGGGRCVSMWAGAEGCAPRRAEVAEGGAQRRAGPGRKEVRRV